MEQQAIRTINSLAWHGIATQDIPVSMKPANRLVSLNRLKRRKE